ncbi:hypothetical protein QQG55_42915 [Brugia pahangi]
MHLYHPKIVPKKIESLVLFPSSNIGGKSGMRQEISQVKYLHTTIFRSPHRFVSNQVFGGAGNDCGEIAAMQRAGMGVITRL